VASTAQLRGLLLEEALLSLLRSAGYEPISAVGGDQTLRLGPGGLCVRGRGCDHQIDAVASLKINPPFSHQQRLLVEAKALALSTRVPVGVVRNTVGVLKDVSEFWVGGGQDVPASKRYHYQAAIFSATPFSSRAQRYAYAHDVYLLPLARSENLRPLIDTVYNVSTSQAGEQYARSPTVQLRALRAELRQRLQAGAQGWSENDKLDWLSPLVRATDAIGETLVASIGQGFPLLLVPVPGRKLSELPETGEIEIGVGTGGKAAGWSIRLAGEREPVLSFDLPEKLFSLYSSSGRLTRQSTVDLKAETLSEIIAIHLDGQELRVFRLRLNPGWLEALRQGLDAP
jgi:hypothetical protein